MTERRQVSADSGQRVKQPDTTTPAEPVTEEASAPPRHWRSDKGTIVKTRDVVATQDRIAKAIVSRHKPRGKMLDPCRGNGAFWKHMPGSEWCEIQEGRDFFDWRAPVDWIIGNPPYSVLNRWLEHSFSLAENVVYLIPIAKVFGSRMRMQMVQRYGGIVEAWAPWTGRDVGFEFGWAVGAVHFKRGFRGHMALDLELAE